MQNIMSTNTFKAMTFQAYDAPSGGNKCLGLVVRPSISQCKASARNVSHSQHWFVKSKLSHRYSNRNLKMSKAFCYSHVTTIYPWQSGIFEISVTPEDSCAHRFSRKLVGKQTSVPNIEASLWGSLRLQLLIIWLLSLHLICALGQH